MYFVEINPNLRHSEGNYYLFQKCFPLSMFEPGQVRTGLNRDYENFCSKQRQGCPKSFFSPLRKFFRPKYALSLTAVDVIPPPPLILSFNLNF